MKNHRIAHKTVLLLLTCLLAVSCYQDVVDLDFSEFGSQIVIEAIITDQPGPYSVNISRTASHNNTERFPLVSGAEVIISDDTGQSELLQEEKAGLYRTRNFQGVPGRTYTLVVRVEGEEYEADCFMPEAMEFDSIGYELYGNDAFLHIEFTTRKDVEDYLKFKLYQNEQNVLNYLFQDRFEDEEHIAHDEFETIFHLYDYIKVEIMAIDKPIYEYFSMLGDRGDNMEVELPDFLPLTAFNPKTNLSNSALGYFSAHALRTYTFVVE
jgi:hypothetical protein